MTSLSSVDAVARKLHKLGGVAKHLPELPARAALVAVSLDQPSPAPLPFLSALYDVCVEEGQALRRSTAAATGQVRRGSGAAGANLRHTDG